MMFRLVQGASVSTLLLMWIVRSATHPGLHPMMLIMAATLAIATEVSYRLGQRDKVKSTRLVDR